MFSRFPAFVVFLGLLAGVSPLAQAAELTEPELAAQLQEAIETGDNARMDALTQPYLAGRTVPEGLSARTYSLLGIAISFQDPGRSLGFFTTARADPAEYTRASFWLGDMFLLQGYVGGAFRVVAEMEAHTPRSPLAIAYLQGRIALHLSEELPFGNPQRDLLRTQVARAIEACATPALQTHADFDPRFVTLTMDWAMNNGDLRAFTDTCEQFRQVRPRSLPNIRRLLAFGVRDLADSRATLLPSLEGKLPADELARWRARAQEAKLASDTNQYGELMDRYANLAASQEPAAADLAPGLLYFIWSAATNLADNHPRKTAAVIRFAERATGQRVATATLALHLIEKLRAQGQPIVLADGAELRMCLVARDYPRAIPLVQAAFAAHADNYRWIRGCWPAIEKGPNALYQQAADALLRLQPKDRFAQLATARAYAATTGSFTRFGPLFDGAPFYGTRETDWRNYHELLLDSASEDDFLDGKKAGEAKAEAAFVSTLERWRKAQRNDPVISEQLALVRIRAANASHSLAAIEAAEAAVLDAMALGTVNPGILSSRVSLGKSLSDYRLKVEAEQRAANAPAKTN